MEFVLYFLLRRFFVKLSLEGDTLFLRKGFLIRRHHRIPLSAVIRADIRRAPLLRLLRGKKLTLYTLWGKVSFYLRSGEEFDILPVCRSYPPIKPRFSSVLAGAFARTKALGGTVVFSVTLVRAGSIFGSGYYDALSELIKGTAQELDELLGALRIAVPRITTLAAVFIAAAWVFAFVRNILRFARLRIYPSREMLRITHGTITLYETMLVHNDHTPVIQRDTAVTLLTDAAPVFRAGAMVIPPMRGQKRRKAMRLLCPTLCGCEAKPPRRALFGHLAVPLGWGAASAALLILTYLTGSDPVLRTLLWGALWVSVWFCFLYGAYMRRSGLRSDDKALCVTARHGTELMTVYVPRNAFAYLRIDSNPFQRRSGMCDIRIYSRSRVKLRLRNMYEKDISAPW